MANQEPTLATLTVLQLLVVFIPYSDLSQCSESIWPLEGQLICPRHLIRIIKRTFSEKGTSSEKEHFRIRVVRLGHPARAAPELQPLSLDARIQGSDEGELVR